MELSLSPLSLSLSLSLSVLKCTVWFLCLALCVRVSLFSRFFIYIFCIFLVCLLNIKGPVKHILTKFYQKLEKLFNGTYNKSVFEKNLSKIEKIVKIFSIFDKKFLKNSIVLCALKIHVNKIQI